MSAIVKKLLLKPGMRLLALNAPPERLADLEPLPDGVVVGTTPDCPADAVLLFASSSSELAQWAPRALAHLKPGGLLWVAFPKGGSKLQKDLTRDRGWEPLTDAGFAGVSLFSWDDTWSCFRLRPWEEIRRR